MYGVYIFMVSGSVLLSTEKKTTILPLSYQLRKEVNFGLERKMIWKKLRSYITLVLPLKQLCRRYMLRILKLF